MQARSVSSFATAVPGWNSWAGCSATRGWRHLCRTVHSAPMSDGRPRPRLPGGATALLLPRAHWNLGSTWVIWIASFRLTPHQRSRHSYFLQRIGRTGRRSGSRRNCLFLATDRDGLIQAAGVIQLWASGYVEPVNPPPMPLHIFAQQIMALALQESGVARDRWHEWIGAMPGFAHVAAATLNAVIDHMVAATLLVSDNGLLSIGGEGENSYGRKNFMALLSCFTSPPLFRVLHGQRELGLIDQISFVLRNEEKPAILLAGRAWQVSHLDWDARIAYVVPTELKGRSQWLGSSPALSFELCQSIRQVISMDGHRPQGSRRACEAIDEMRFEMSWCHADSTTIVPSGPGACEWWTFAGLRANATFAEAFIALGVKAAAENFSVKVNTEVNVLQATLMDQVWALAPELCKRLANHRSAPGISALPWRVQVNSAAMKDYSAARAGVMVA